MIAIINYGLGNLTSIKNMCKRLSVDALITDKPEDIKGADRLILPGVGHFKRGMNNLETSGLKEVINEEVLSNNKPILGICLGAQLMTQHSEEGDVDGLGWVDATTVRFDSTALNGLPVPHMGWSDVKAVRECRLWKDVVAEPRYYFVHAYHFKFHVPDEVIGTARYGYEFACAFNKENIYGVQFHPEKSHKFGMKVLTNFNSL